MIASIVSQVVNNPIADRLRGAIDNLPDCQCDGVVTWEQAQSVVRSRQPQLVLVCVDADEGLEILQRLRAVHAAALVAVGPVVDPRFILKTLHCGADHFLDQEEPESELGVILGRLKGKQEKACKGRVVTLLSASGGCGASTIAVNLAATLAVEKQTCGLVDLNPGRGDLAALLDLQPGFTLADLFQNESRLDEAMFEKMLATHASGIRLLAASQDFSDVKSLTARGVTQALELARRFFPDTIVDLEDCFQDEQLAALQQADVIYLISRLDFTSIRNARRILDRLAKLDMAVERIKVVINQFAQAKQLPVEEAERALGGRLQYFVPYDAHTVGSANNTGVPAVLNAPKSKWAAAIQKLANPRADGHNKNGSRANIHGRALWSLSILFKTEP